MPNRRPHTQKRNERIFCGYIELSKVRILEVWSNCWMRMCVLRAVDWDDTSDV